MVYSFIYLFTQQNDTKEEWIELLTAVHPGDKYEQIVIFTLLLLEKRVETVHTG